MKKVLFLMAVLPLFVFVSCSDDDNDEYEVVKVVSISLDESEKRLALDESFTLGFTINPSDATNQHVKWSSDDSSVATVKKGVVTAVSVGETFINISVAGTKHTDRCKIVVSPIGVESILLDKTELEIEKDREETIHATVSPDNATCKDIMWESSDSNIATVINGKIRGINVGTCVVSVLSKDGQAVSECSVKVIPVKVQGITAENTQIKILEGESFVVDYSIQPEDAENKEVTINVVNDEIVSVNPDGSFVGKQVGITDIVITTKDGGFKETISVEVVDITSFIRLTYGGSFVNVGGYVTATASCYITNNSTKDIELTRFEIINSTSGSVLTYTEEESKLGILASGSKKGLGVNLNRAYTPVVRWYFKYNGNTYKVYHSFD